MRNTMTQTTCETSRCLRCRRPLRSAEAVARGYGSGCWAKVRKAETTADLSAWTPAQVEDARQAIEDGAVVPSTREGVYHVVSSDGTEVHRTHLKGCNCESGLKTRPSRPCYHRCAIAIITASKTPADAKPVTPVAIPAPAPAGDLWAEMDRWNDALMAMAS